MRVFVADKVADKNFPLERNFFRLERNYSTENF